MDRRRATTAITTAGTLIGLLILTGTVAAQSKNRDLIEGLNYQLHYVALPLTLFVLMILAYAAIKFYDNDDPKPTAEDPALEITWVAATAVILLFVGIAAYSVLISPYVSPSQPIQPTADQSTEEFSSINNLPDTGDEQVVVRGYQWDWAATYPEANITTENEIVIPANKSVTIWLTTSDVIHSFFVSDLGFKQDVYPGEYTRVRTYVYEPGRYQAACAEYCGAGHSRMRADVIVVDQETYNQWLEENSGSQATAPTPEK